MYAVQYNTKSIPSHINDCSYVRLHALSEHAPHYDTANKRQLIATFDAVKVDVLSCWK